MNSSAENWSKQSVAAQQLLRNETMHLFVLVWDTVLVHMASVATGSTDEHTFRRCSCNSRFCVDGIMHFASIIVLWWTGGMKELIRFLNIPTTTANNNSHFQCVRGDVMKMTHFAFLFG